MNTNNNLLTIVMPAYNAEKYINSTFESFVQQIFKDWTLLVIDDNSKDNTWYIIQEWSKKDSRIIGIHNETNLKVAKTMNKGIQLVESKYFARVDSDDVLLPNHFSEIIKYLEYNIEIDICGSQVITIDGNGNFRRKWNYETDSDWVKISSIFACPFLQSSVVMKTDVIKELGGYRPEMELVEDYELWIRALRKYKGASISNYTIQYRIHENNMSETNKSTILKMLESMYTENSQFYPIDLSKLKLHARMEVGEWSGISQSEWRDLSTWKKELIRLNKVFQLYENTKYKNVLNKYFTNAYLKIATQNGGTVRVKSLIQASKNITNLLFIIRRKVENKKEHL